MPTLTPADPFKIFDQLTPAEQQVKQQAHAFVQAEIMPHIVGWNKHENTPWREVMKQLGHAKLFGATLSEHGGRGASNISYGLINREMEYADSAFRSALSVQSGLVIHPIHTFGSDEQKKRWLPGLMKGELIGCFGLSERQAGSDPAAKKTYAKRDGTDWILHGEKYWITLAPWADLFVVWAKDEHDHTHGFVLEKDMAGLSSTKIEGKYVIKAIQAGNILMENVRVPETNRLPNAQGLKAAFSCLNRARYGISWGVLGAAQACFDIALNYTLERHQWGGALAGKQLIQKKLADISTELTLGHLLAFQLGKLMDNGTAVPDMISMAKRNNTGKALEICRTARDMLGGNGVDENYHVIRHAVNLEAVNTYEGTHDIHALIIGKALTDVAAF